MAVDPKINVVNPEDEIFWKKVREAFDQVNMNTQLSIRVEVGSRQASVSAITKGDEEFTHILVTEITPDPPTLVVP